MSMNSDDYEAAAKKAADSVTGYVKTHVTISACAVCLLIGVILGKMF